MVVPSAVFDFYDLGVEAAGASSQPGGVGDDDQADVVWPVLF